MFSDPFANPEPLIRRVYSYVVYRLGDVTNAEDVTSETFERALRYRESFDPRRGDVAAWLIGIARRCIADASTRVDVVVGEPIEAGGAEHEEDSIRKLTIGAALARLNERERELIALRYGGDLTTRQIGEAMGMKTGAVEVALHRSLKTLRALLETDEFPGLRPARDVTWATPPSA